MEKNASKKRDVATKSKKSEEEREKDTLIILRTR